MVITLNADGQERIVRQTTPMTVGDFLRGAGVALGDSDEVTPPVYTQLRDALRVTVVRVTETTECRERDIPFQERRILNEALGAGEERVGQGGQSGIEEVCNRIIFRDSAPSAPIPLRTTVIRASEDAIIYVGPTGTLDPVAVRGTLAYLSNGNVWVMRGNSSGRQLLTDTNDADGRVLTLSEDGTRLLYTRAAEQTVGAFNTLWMIENTFVGDPRPVQLRPINVLYADWVPGQSNTISYSMGEPVENAPGWQAFNDLWLMRIDPVTGDALNAQEIVRRSSGWLYSWWGTAFSWSPTGERLAWARADSMGLVDLSAGSFTTLLNYPVFSTNQPWSWRADIDWSPDGSLLLTTVHGLPIGSEPPETSPAFHVAITDVRGSFSAEVGRNAGIWSKPRYSPTDASGGLQIAYLRARDLANSIGSSAEYDLMIADSDGSNSRRLFPPDGQSGISGSTPYFTWSPFGDQIALIYGGNLTLVDVPSGTARQLTLDRSATLPIWTR